METSTSASVSWLKLHDEYGLGKIIDNKNILWSRDDLKQWQRLVDASKPALEAIEAGANRTDLAKHTAYEKRSKVSIQKDRLFCNAINGPLYLKNGAQAVQADVEYRVHYQDIDIDRYSACVIIENQESFVYCHRFKWPELPETLMLYRGHDNDVHTLQALLDSRGKTMKGSMRVCLFFDPDPAGLSLAIGKPEATHIITPDIKSLPPEASKRQCFATHLQRYPNLQAKTMAFSQDVQDLAEAMLDKGIAVSQEWLCAHEVPLQLIKLHK